MFWIAAGIVLVTLLVYLPALQGGFVWDDDDYVTENMLLRSFTGLFRIWFEPGATYQYYPLVHSTFWLEYHLWGLNPFGYHLVNIALHAASAILLGLVLTRLQLPGAWLAAALFAIHPVQVESVAWITERKNVLSGLFYLGSALAYLRFAEVSGPERRKWLWYAGSLLLFIFALWAKSVTCTLPIALLIVLWWKKGRLHWEKDALPLLPMLGVGTVLALFTIWMEANKVGAQGEEWSFSLVERWLIAGRAMWFYLYKLIWPAKLTFIYPRWVIDPAALWQYLFALAALVGFAGLWAARKTIGRGPLAAALFFLVTVSPALGFINYYPMIYSFVADHFQYLACIGPVTLFAVWISGFRNQKSEIRNPAWLMSACVLAVLSVLTWRQAGVYSNIETLWEDTLQKNPRAWMAHTNLGAELVEQDRLEEAESHFYQAMRLRPGYDNAHYNMGAVLARQGRIGQAVEQYREAIRLNPDSAQAHNNLGKIFAEHGQLELATAHLRRAIEIKPDYAKALNNLGIVHAELGELDKAIGEYQKALRADPDFFDPHNNVGVALARAGRLEESIFSFEAAVRLRPDSAEARNNLAFALTQAGRLDAALRQYREALRINPDLARARRGLAEVEQALGRPAGTL